MEDSQAELVPEAANEPMEDVDIPKEEEKPKDEEAPMKELTSFQRKELKSDLAKRIRRFALFSASLSIIMGFLGLSVSTKGMHTAGSVLSFALVAPIMIIVETPVSNLDFMVKILRFVENHAIRGLIYIVISIVGWLSPMTIASAIFVELCGLSYIFLFIKGEKRTEAYKTYLLTSDKEDATIASAHASGNDKECEEAGLKPVPEKPVYVSESLAHIKAEHSIIGIFFSPNKERKGGDLFTRKKRLFFLLLTILLAIFAAALGAMAQKDAEINNYCIEVEKEFCKDIYGPDGDFPDTSIYESCIGDLEEWKTTPQQIQMQTTFISVAILLPIKMIVRFILTKFMPREACKGTCAPIRRFIAIILCVVVGIMAIVTAFAAVESAKMLDAEKPSAQCPSITDPKFEDFEFEEPIPKPNYITILVQTTITTFVVNELGVEILKAIAMYWLLKRKRGKKPPPQPVLRQLGWYIPSGDVEAPEEKPSEEKPAEEQPAESQV